MLKNSSDNARTLRATLLNLPGDTWDMDNLSYYGVYENMTIFSGFLMDKFMDHFEAHLIEIDLDPIYHYTPSLFAHDYYGTAGLDFLVMYMAKCLRVFDFNMDTIKVIPLGMMSDLNDIIIKYREEIDASRENPEVFHMYVKTWRDY